MSTLQTDISTTREWLDLSLAQRAVWLDASLSNSPSSYVLVRWARLHGSVDPSLAQQALTLMTARHDALRLRVDSELPRQWIHAASDAPFSNLDFSHESDPAGALQTHLDKTTATGMPLGDCWLFSLELIKLGALEYFLLARCHHLLADESAVSMILAHWLDAYRALNSESISELAPPSSYSSVILSDTAYSGSARYKQDLDYWLGRFRSLPPRLIDGRSLNGDVPEVVRMRLDGLRYNAFSTACTSASLSPQRVIFSLFRLAVGRRYGQPDLIIGMALHRRDASNIHVVGMLAGIVPVRYELKDDLTLLGALHDISAQVDRDLRHQRLPVDVLSRELGIRGDVSELFQVAFSFVPSQRGPGHVHLDGITIEVGGIPSREASPVTIHAYEQPDNGGIHLDISAHPGFLEPEEPARLIELFEIYLNQFVDEPQAELETLPVVTPAEKLRVVFEWNATAAEYPLGRAEHFFHLRVIDNPNQLAIVSQSESLTYAELDSRSNQLARAILACGMPSQSVIGVAIERSASSVLALLAILKAGCTYLPVDPSYPPERLAHMLADSNASLVITNHSVSKILPDAVSRLFIDDVASWAGDSHALPGFGLLPEEPAYIIYTSGSTGKPKGVVVSHAAAVNLAFARLRHDPISAGDRILAAISVGFDVSVGQLLLPLLSGATIVIAGDIRDLTPRDFWQFLQQHGVTHVNSVPSFFESILDAAPRSSSLIRLMLGGEPLSSTLVRRLHQVLPNTQVFNMYGPTEACIDATVYAATPFDSAAVLPIGKPLPNYRAYILNEHLNPTGIGVPGDLYIAGAGLAHSYINQPALTAERFIANPFEDAGQRLYKTGDRARWRSDGNIDFLGRADSQVKIRGHRIELGEIEASLLLHPAVAQAAVVANNEKPGTARLVAYVVPHSPVDATQLRAHLANHVPGYMIPAAFSILSALPLTPNGKLDQRSLPPVDWQSGRTYRPPSTNTETMVAELFAELLGVRQVSASDSFFELGGHSLLAARLVSQLRARFGVNLTLRALFQASDVEAIARMIDSASSSPALVFSPLTRPELIPLSFTQERLWFLSQLQKDDSYNIPIAVSVHGPLDASGAASALTQIIRRHEALRTSILMENGQAVQRVRDVSEFHVSLSAVPDLESLNARLSQLASTSFDLASGLPIEAEIITVSENHHVVASVIHHSAFDGWSAKIFFEEFARLYSNLSLPSLAIQYSDFAVWQRQLDFAADVAWWKESLAGAPPFLDLPAAQSPSELSRRPAATVPIVIESGLHDSLQKLANANGATLFMLLHAAFAALLARWSGQNDIVIGTVVANRTHSEFEQLIGCFVNTIPLRTKLSPLQPFSHLLAQVRDFDLAAFDHQAVPFEKLVDELQPERSLARTPVFQVMLVLQNQSFEQVQLPGLIVEPVALQPSVAKFNLTLNLEHCASDHSLVGCLEYAADIFETSSMQRFAGEFQRLLEVLSESPSSSPMQIDLLSAMDRRQILSSWNDTSAEYPVGRLETLFGRRVTETPDALAVIDASWSLTYAELDRYSNQLAQHLFAADLKPQSVVAVLLNRSASTVISFLGILKSGCTYLPLDPSYPVERLAHMLSDSGAKLVITTASLAGNLPSNLATMLIDDAQSWCGQPDSPLARTHSASHAAYIIYTSGSTGKPKGVVVPHTAAVNLAFARLKHDPICVGDRILAAISVGFDVSIGQLLLPLLSGATVVIADDLRNVTPVEFWRFLQTNQVTHINSVPSFIESVLKAAPRSTHLKRLMLGGEALSSSLVRRLAEVLPDTQVFNMYGPTEACIDATCYRATGKELSIYLPIGKPLPNYRAYILNGLLEPVSVGVTGDLYLAGQGLARCYVNQPALTAERFIADPFTGFGGRLYRTGDRARWLPDGNIEFLGRADNQVKIRGHRIELGEIESALLLQPGVLEAAVMVREDTPANQRLVAYYTSSHALAADSLRTELSRFLPAYMVPSAYVSLDALPLTANGKLDRKALPVPGSDSEAARPFEPPQNLAEQQIAAIFAEVLRLTRVGRDDNFFELGGHSLLAMTVIDRMGQAGLPVDVRHLFTSPTVAGLANTLSGPSQDIAVPPNLIPSAAVAITPDMLPLLTLSQGEIDSLAASVPGGVGNIQDIYPLAPLQEGILFHHLMSKTGDAYLTPFLFGFKTRASLQAFLDALAELVARHDILRTAILWEGIPEPVQVVLRHASVLCEEVASNGIPDVALHLRDKFDPRHFRIDVRQAPMLRAFISEDTSNQRWLLLLMTHHLILDHTSMEVVLHEAGLISSARRDLLPEATPFRDFVARARLGISQQEHESFFREALGDVQETTAPYGLTHVQAEGAAIREFTLALDTSVSKRLREHCRLLGITPASLFHLAWALVLAHISGRADVVFGTLLLGRLQSGRGSQRTLGLFINTLPFRLRLDGTSVEAALQHTHHLLAQLIRHENASLALAQRCSGVPAPAPLFSSLFNFRQSAGVASEGAQTLLPGVELVYAQERTDYPVAVAIDDHPDNFSITAQADMPADPAHVCRYLETTVSHLLSALETNPSQSINRIEVLPLDQHTQVVEQWNNTSALYPTGSLSDLFEQQVNKTPDATALMSASSSLTYAELNRQSEHLAAVLMNHGVTSHSVVGVALPRSVSTVASFLAILKLGAIYLPLDPGYPAERLAHMISDSGATVVIAGESVRPSLPAGVSVLSPDIQGGSAKFQKVFVHPTSTAYIIYTSGSTGRPKGVAVSHTAAVNLAFARHTHDPIAAGSRILAAISVGFDVSIGQLLLPLLSGATVVIAGDLRALTLQQFWSFIGEHKVTHINSVPSFFDSILDASPGSSSLVRLMLGGEPLTPALVRRLHERLPATEIVNMYGPTEACIDATCYPVSGQETAPVLPIGKPLPNYRAYILNQFLQPAGMGVEGDLYLAGAGLAHGYINQPALTAGRFIADPFGLPGQRIYKTGDRARWRSDGNIEFLGRADTQVKIRGHRIELGEIESAMLLHPSVAQAVVVANAARLIAYVVFKSGEQPASSEALRELLSRHLPEYMMPALFITLSAMPLTPNGKIDLKALPSPSVDRTTEAAYAPPVTETEITMERLWRQVLGVERIGINDDFFTLGGHSLAVMRLISLCNSQFKTSLALRSLFDNPTIAKLSNAIDTNANSTAHPSLVSLRPSGTKIPLFCVHPAGGAVLRYVPLTNALSPDQPVYGLQARALLEGEPLGKSMEEMASDYINAIQSVQPKGPYQLLGWSSGGMLCYEMAQQLTGAGETVSFLGLMDTSLPDYSKRDPSEKDLMHAFAVTFGYEDLWKNPKKPKSSLELQERIFAANRLPQGLDFPQFQRFYAVFCNTLSIYGHYVPKPWPGPFTLFRALQRSSSMPNWSKLVGRNATYIDLDCTHADLPSDKIAPILASHIEKLLK
jgi:amino acid adenylation domain-containing protein